MILVCNEEIRHRWHHRLLMGLYLIILDLFHHCSLVLCVQYRAEQSSVLSCQHMFCQTVEMEHLKCLLRNGNDQHSEYGIYSEDFKTMYLIYIYIHCMY